MGVPVDQEDPVVRRYEDAVGIGDQAVAPGGAEGARRLERDDRRVGALIGVDPAVRIHGELAERGEPRVVRQLAPGPLDPVAPVAHDDHQATITGIAGHVSRSPANGFRTARYRAPGRRASLARGGVSGSRRPP